MNRCRVFGVLLVAIGCTPAATPTSATFDAEPAEEAPATGCPLGVRGAAVQVTDVKGGAALSFTSPYRVEELRLRVRTAAEIRGPGSQKGLGHDGRHMENPPVHHGLQPYFFPPARVAVEDIEAGARLYLVALYPDDAERIRRHARERAADMMDCR